MKFLLVGLLFLLIIVTPALGKNEDKSSNGQGQSNKQEDKKDNNQGNSQSNNQENKDNSNSNQGSDKQSQSAEAGKKGGQSSNTPTSTVRKLNSARGSTATDSGQQCDPSFPWKNHGEYVSCVAKSGAGGKAVSEAARSDIGRKKSGTPSASLSPSPDASSSATPSAIVSPTPEATSSGLISSITESIGTVQERIISIGDQFAALLELLNIF